MVCTSGRDRMEEIEGGSGREEREGEGGRNETETREVARGDATRGVRNL